MSIQLKRNERARRRRKRRYKISKDFSPREIELKFFGDSARKDLHTIFDTGDGKIVNSLNPISLGTDVYERIGDTIYIHSIHVKGEIKGHAFLAPWSDITGEGLFSLLDFETNFVRLVLIQDTQPNGQPVEWTDVFAVGHPDYRSLWFKDLSKFKRFKILANEIIQGQLPCLSSTVAVTNPVEGEPVFFTWVTRGGFSKYFEINITPKSPIRIDFDEASVGMKARTNNLFILAMTEFYWFIGFAGTEILPEIPADQLILNYRIRYSDY